MNIQVNLNEPGIMQKLTSDKMGKFVSFEWKRLIDPYTPQDTAMLMQTVNILPFELHYKVPYAEHVYYGEDMNFQKDKSPYATHHWDFAAESAGQKDKLYRIINSALKSGRI